MPTATKTTVLDPDDTPVMSAGMEDLTAIEAEAQIIADALAVADRARARRDALIVEARIDGFPWERIAVASDMLRQSTELAARKANGGVLPKPRQQSK